MAVSLSISITQNSQSIANNTSNVTVRVRASWTYGSYNLTNKSGWLKIDGTTYSFTNSFNDNQTTSGSKTLFTKTVNVSHDTNGEKKLYCSASYTTGVSSGTIAASVYKTLTTIPRASSLTASNGVLGTAQTLTITRADDSFVHKISYTCGGTSGYAVGSSSVSTSSTSISWTPPLSLASQNTTGTSVSISLCLKTYNSGGTQIGTETKTITCTIPSSVKPTVSAKVTDAMGYYSTYGAFIQGMSKLSIEVTATTSYGAKIISYKTTANGSTYTTQSIMTDVLKSAGDLSVSCTVKDARSRTGTYTYTKTSGVLEYKTPAVDKLAVKRCDEDGTDNDQGAYCQVTFGATVSDLGSKNTAAYTLRYKPSSSGTYTEVSFDSLANNYSVSGQTYIFAADTGSTYDVELYVKDNFITTKQATAVSTAFTIMHWKADGTGMGIGKVAEESYLLDVAMDARFNDAVCGNVMGLNKLPEIPSNSDLNDYMTTGSYAIYKNAYAATIANVPVARAGRLEVNSSTGEGIRETQWSYIRQRYIPYNSPNAVWERDITRSTDNVWTYGDWWRSSLTPDAAAFVYNEEEAKMLWGGDLTSGMYMTAGHTITLTEAVSAQRHGIVLVFCYYNGTDDTNYNFQSFFVPKALVALETAGHTFMLNRAKFTYVGTKYLYIKDTSISGHADNSATGSANGITYANNKFVLRYVIGV